MIYVQNDTLLTCVQFMLREYPNLPTVYLAWDPILHAIRFKRGDESSRGNFLGQTSPWECDEANRVTEFYVTLREGLVDEELVWIFSHEMTHVILIVKHGPGYKSTHDAEFDSEHLKLFRRMSKAWKQTRYPARMPTLTIPRIEELRS